MAFVLVQHLDPDHASELSQILGRVSALPVLEIMDGLPVAPDHVYVIPPNRSLSLSRGHLRLHPLSDLGAMPHTIDGFFQSLALNQCERAIGIILSGNATDGTVGLEAIKAEGGITFAQDASAGHASMPRSAVDAGCVDCVLPPEGIAQELARIAKHPYSAPAQVKRQAVRAPRPADTASAAGAASELGERASAEDYRQILLLLREHTGVDFSQYKTTTIHRRISRRAVLNKLATLGAYADYLRENPAELDPLYADMLINVTSFFRNPEAFDVLRKKVFPALLKIPGDELVRFWVLGCSTGQEAYSLAMLFNECAAQIAHPRKLQIFATDLSELNLEKARRGLYTRSQTEDLAPERLKRFFTEEEGGFRVIKALREQIVFARQNLISDPPFSQLDMISCRNLMIYLEPCLQKKAVPTFHFTLKPHGYLFLGASESIGGFSDLFAPIDRQQKIYVKKAVATPTFYLPVKSSRGERVGSPGLRSLSGTGGPELAGGAASFTRELSAEREADRMMVNVFAPPSVLINADLHILQFRGATGGFLEPPSGKASLHVLKMARAGLMLPLRAVIAQAKKEHKIVRHAPVSYELDGKSRRVQLVVIPLKNLKEACFLILFELMGKNTPALPALEPEVKVRRSGPKHADAAYIARLERDLADTRDYLQSTQEQHESAHEELQTSSEEAQSSNEELQSLNEELETSKEELESTNEELITVNEELATRNQELSQLNHYLVESQEHAEAIIRTVPNPLVVLTADLCLQTANEAFYRAFKLTPAKAHGRLIFKLGNGAWDIPRLRLLLEEIIPKNSFFNDYELTHTFAGLGRRSLLLNARMLKATSGRPKAILLGFKDVTEVLAYQAVLRRSELRYRRLFEASRDGILMLDPETRKITEANPFMMKLLGYSREQLLKKELWEIGLLQDEAASQKAFLALKKDGFIRYENLPLKTRGGQRCEVEFVSNLYREDDEQVIQCNIRDITARKQSEEYLLAARTELTARAAQLEEVVATRTAEITAANHRLKASVAFIKKGKETYRLLLADSELMQRKLRGLTRQFLTEQENERKAISRELHDDVVQMLVGINMELSSLAKVAALGGAKVRAKIRHTQRLVEKSVTAVHSFARELRPAVLDDLGLIPAIHAYVKVVAARKKMKISFIAFPGVEALDGDKRTVLYRVAQEALNNIVRHAKATEVVISITHSAGAIRLELHDNGKSFVVSEVLNAKTNKRLGLVGMRERLAMVGGSLHLESAPGHGTIVRAEIPFAKC